MSLSSELISQFVKSTKDEVVQKKESTVYGEMVEYQGRMYVRIDGSDRLTPTSSTTDAKAGDRVSVMIKDHSAIVTGNLTSPAARLAEVKDLGNQIGEFETVMAHQVVAEDIDAINARISSLKATVGTFSSLTTDELAAVTAQIETIQSKIVNADHLTAMDVDAINADIENLRATFGTFTSLSASDLEAVNADIDNLKAYNANFTYVSTESLKAVKADIDDLYVNKASVESLKAVEADIDDLYVNKASIESLKAVEADIDDLYVKKASASSLEAAEAKIEELDTAKLSAKDADMKYANIDFSNIGKAAMEYFYAHSGLIKDVTIGDSTITGELVGVTIKGDLIEGNTIKADKLVIKGEDGLYYKLNTDGVTTEAEQTAYNSINGNVILAKSITASKISVSDLVAFGATIGGFKITDKSIYSGVKESATNTTRGVYLDKDGQLSVGDSNQYFRYYKDQNGDYLLEISAKSLRFSTSGKSVEEEISDVRDTAQNAQDSVNNLEIGGRNLVPSSFLIYGGNTKEFTISNWSAVLIDTANILSILEPSTEYVLKYDAELVGRTDKTYKYDLHCGFLFYSPTTSSANREAYIWSFTESAEIGDKYSKTTVFTTPEELPSDYRLLVYTRRWTSKENGAGAAGYDTIKFTNFKLEKGNKATDWTPAHEDADKAVDDASKVATNYMNFDETDGLVVGNMTADTLGNNVRIDTDSVDIRSGSNVLATFAANLISLGKAAANAVIELCGGVGKIQADYDEDKDPLYTSIFNRLWIISKKVLLLRGTDIDLSVSTQHEYPNQTYDNLSSATIYAGCGTVLSNDYGENSGLSSSSFNLTSKNNVSNYQVSLTGLTSTTEGILPFLEVLVSQPSGYGQYTFTADEFKLSKSIKLNSTKRGYYLVDSTGASYPAIFDNGSNLWIGASQTNSTHHIGGTYISAGHNGTSGNTTIYIAVPNTANNNCTGYGVFHTGYLDVSKATAGTLPIARGGTGGTTATAATTNLEAMRSPYKNGYRGMATPGNDEDAWIRTTANGLIPYKSGGGSSALGTANWPFSKVYSANYYHNGDLLLFRGQVLYQGNLANGGTFSTTKYTSYKCFVAILSDWHYAIGYRWDVNAGISMGGQYDGGPTEGSWAVKASFSVSFVDTTATLKLVGASKHKLLASGNSHSASTLNVLYVLGIF